MDLKQETQELPFFLVSILINIFLFSGLAMLFTMRPLLSQYQNPPVNVQLINPPKEVPTPPKPIKLQKFHTKKAYSKPLSPAKGYKPSRGVHKPLQTSALRQRQVFKKGDIKIPVVHHPPKAPPKNISVLSSLEKEIEAQRRQAQTDIEGAIKQVGNLSATISSRGSYLHEGSRKLIYAPPAPVIRAGEFPAPMVLRIFVSPSGYVTRIIILRRSGIAYVDREVVNYVRRFRFEPINGPVESGTITINFKGG
ncbi:TonB family protein [Hydrogenobaculum sp. Y04AAS1]|uniref:TonB family protein n=1 Tax=Hydrogenobaculum sp. (strain Y04AAS1) TaxID=380749 RepID=UPI00015BD481|nr:TonB family protein [Hydrogenobaculum sp. Y04AAS1]HCT66365.1 TonB family protein [Hydrogenobaculum sp.]